MDQKLTVVISVFNGENYISSFIQNLMSQTNPNFLCVIVDDGSKDNTAAVCKKSIQDDSRFSFLRHEKNLGLGAGRLTGIQNSKTGYITFMDADDEIDLDAIDKILSQIEETPSDLIVFDYYKKDEKGNIRLVTDSSKTPDELFKSKSSLVSHVWHKVYKKTLLERLDYSFYKTVSFAEDLWLCTNCFLCADSVSIVHKAYYTYKYNSDSLVHTRTEKTIRENIDVLKNILSDSRLREKKEIEQYIRDDSFYAFGMLIFPNPKNDFQQKPHFSEWRELDKERYIYIPRKTRLVTRIYIWLIRAKLDFAARILWGEILWLKIRRS